MTSPSPSVSGSGVSGSGASGGPRHDRRNLVLWALRLTWFIVPVIAGPLFSNALAPTGNGFRLSVTVALWFLWGLGVLASLVPHPISLSAVRVIITSAVPLGAWALLSADAEVWPILGLALLIVAAGISLLPDIAARFLDGESYGDERRLPLRPPAGVMFGPLPLAWLMTIAGLITGPLLLAAQRWMAGAVACVLGIPLAVLALRSLHTLTRRFLVFVPAGFVVHDLSALTDPILFRREDVQVIGPAFADSVATDLTLGASGLALEARFTKPLNVPVRPRPQRRGRQEAVAPETLALRSILVSPSQPGEVLAEAERRRLSVG